MFRYITLHFKWRFHTFYHPRHPFSHRLSHISIDILLYGSLLVLAVLSLIFSLWRPVAGVFPYKLTLNELPNEIVYNTKIPLSFQYTNTTRTRFDSLILELSAPKEFEVQKNIQLSPTEKNKWLSATTVIRAKGSIGHTTNVTAQIKGLKNNKERVVATLSFPITITQSHFMTDFIIPAFSVQEKNITGSIFLSNPTTERIENISLILKNPVHFHQRDSSVIRASLQPGEKKTIEIQGFFDKKSHGKQLFSLSTILKDREEEYVQHILSSQHTVIQSPLTFTPRTSLKPLTSGVRQDIIIDWKNTSPVPLSHVTLGMVFNGELLNTKSISSQLGILDKKNTRLLWTKKQLKTLSQIPANATGSLAFSFAPITKQTIKNTILGDTSIHLTPFSIFSLPEGQPITQYDVPMQFDITTQLHPAVTVRYYSPQGDQLGRGPLPPQVGKETKYIISLSIKSSLHDAKNVTINAKLTPAARWTGFVPQGSENLTYNPTNRILSWYSDTINPNDTPESEVVIFEIGVTPEVKDRGTVMTLLENIEISGKDAVTMELIKLSLPPLTTNLIQDKKAQNKGVIVQ